MSVNSLQKLDDIKSRIYSIRGKQVMIDRDLAKLYGVETKRLNEQVRRNIKRFPEEFMFQLSKDELKDWKSQFAASNTFLEHRSRTLEKNGLDLPKWM